MEKVIPRVRTFRRLKVLTRREARVLHALAETVFPSENEEMPSVDETEVIEYLDDILFHLQLKERLLIRGLVALLEVQMLAFNGLKPRLFTQATFEERTLNLAGWEASRIFQRRLVFMAIRTLLLWAYADSHEVERSMGFVPGTRRTVERQAELQAVAENALNIARGNTEAAAPLDSLGLDAPRAAKSSSK